jgi:hypothetical protein
MICKNCGKEIPENAKFCGFCGTPVVQETADAVSEEADTKQPADEASAASPEEVQETPAEAAPEETEKAAPSDNEEHSLGSDIGDTIKNTAAGKVLLGDDGKLNKDDFARMGSAAKESAANAYKSISWSEFKMFLEILKDPFGDHALGILPSCVIVVAAVLLNWWAFSGFLDGLVITALIYAGYFLVLFICKNEDKFDAGKAFGRASQLLTLPLIGILLMCLFAISMKSSLNNTYSMIGGLNSYLYTLRSSITIVLIFLIFATVTYIMGMVKIGSKMNGYLLAVIITAIFALGMFYLMSEMLGAITSIL